MAIMEKPCKYQCQSCGMPLKNGENSGTEADGSKSTAYCYLCYENGKFTAPDCTINQMQGIVDKALKERGWWKPMRWFATSQIPNLERWKNAT